jgi:3-hydroxyisobutyrate dehydrogenase
MSIRAGFIGLGNIGQPMAARIVASGIATTVFDRRPEPCRALAAMGAGVAPSAAALAANVDVVGVCVRDDAEVDELLLGAGGVLAGAAAGVVVAIHSTVTPATVRALGEAAAPRGIALLDAPITGGAAGAENGTLTYMVGGEAAALERCRPVFATSAGRIVHTGVLGTGAATKLGNNLMQYMEFLGAREAAALARSAGVAIETLIEVSRSVGIMSDAMASVIAFGDRLAANPGDPALMARAQHFAALAEKDLAVTLECARAEGIDLPGTVVCRALMRRTYGLPDEGTK